MKFNEKYEIDDEFASLFNFASEKAEIKHDAHILMFKFLSEIERVTENTLQNKDLANALDRSRSFISQLFKGNKLANLLTLAKLQKSYNLTFDIKAVPNPSNSLSLMDSTTYNNQYESPKEINIENYNPKLTFILGNKPSDKMQQAS